MRSSLPFGQFPIGITLLLLLMASSASASDGMRCGSKVITDGESRERVLALCGEPAGVTQSYIMRQPSFSRNNRVVYYGSQLAEVLVETWTYNFGPNKLMRRLRFVDGILEDIVTLGYGYNPPQKE
jgi:hypothetical protein